MPHALLNQLSEQLTVRICEDLTNHAGADPMPRLGAPVFAAMKQWYDFSPAMVRELELNVDAPLSDAIGDTPLEAIRITQIQRAARSVSALLMQEYNFDIPAKQIYDMLCRDLESMRSASPQASGARIP